MDCTQRSERLRPSHRSYTILARLYPPAIQVKPGFHGGLRHMSQPFSGFPDPGTPRPIRRRFQPGVIQESLRAALRKAQRYGEDLWLRGKRNPRPFAIAGGVVAVALVGAYALSGSGTKSLCAPAGGKTPPFVLLMDPVPHPA